MKPNNVIRLLDSKKIPYSVHEFSPKKLSALEVAETLGVQPQQVFKTIVVLRQHKGKPILAVVPGPLRVDLKALAKVVGKKKVRTATHSEAERLTGLQVGGISPLALLKHGFETILDTSAQEYEQIYISGGQRGLNIHLPVADFSEITKAALAKIAY